MKHTSEDSGDLRLSLEELALILSLVGQAPLAKSMLTEELGDMSPDELRGRIQAAGNTLLAKDAFHLNGETFELSSPYARVLGPMMNADYAIQCTAFAVDQPGRTVMFYVKGDEIVEHHAINGIYHSLQRLEDLSTAVDGCEALLQLSPDDGQQAIPFTLDQKQTQNARLLDDDLAATLRDRLDQLGVDSATASHFSEDLGTPREWASALRLSMASDNRVMTVIGYELLTGSSGRTWLMTVDDNDGKTGLRVRPAQRSVVRDLTRAMFTSGQPGR